MKSSFLFIKLKSYKLNLFASPLFVYLCKEQFIIFTIMSFVLISVFYISQELAKYQKDATYDHGFLHSRSVIG